MSLSADKNLEMMFPNIGHVIPAKSNVASTYYKGGLMDIDANGYAVKAADTAGHRFAGVLKEQVVVGAGETKDLEIIRGTLAWLPHGGAAQSDVGKMLYATADDTITDFASNAGPIGKCVAWKTGYLLIDLGQAEVKIRSGQSAVTGNLLNIDTGLRVIKQAWASVKIATQGAGEAGYATVNHEADGLLDLYCWDDGGAAATVAATVYWIAIGE